MKFKLTKNKKETIYGTLFQIQATMSFGDVEKGDLGGWISKEENLNQEGNAWVSGDALVSGDARVFGNAQVSGDARVFGNAQVYGNAWVYGNTRVSGDARVFGNAQVYGDALVYGNARVYGDALVYGNARVFGKLKILTGYFFGVRYQKEEIKYKELDENYDLIYKGKAKFEEEDDEVEKAIKLLEDKGKLKDGKILI